MAEGYVIAAVEGGKLRTLAQKDSPREAVLALPLGRLLMKVVRVPAENREDVVGFVTPILQAMSPYPDEPLTVSCEKVSEQNDALVVIAAALPESAADDIIDHLDAAKLTVTRVDALCLGALRGLWSSLGTEDAARRLVIFNAPDGLAAIVLDGDLPAAVRAVSAAASLRLELMRLLLEAEAFGGAKPLKEIVYVSGAGEVIEEDATFSATKSDLETFAPVRKLFIGEDAALVGVGERTEDASALNALPASWREVLMETRFKRKMVRHLIVAGAIWTFFAAIVFGVPFGYGFFTDHQKQLCKDHRRAYEQVKEMKEKVELVQKYSDHARGALEIMKAVSDRLPIGITLSSWNYRREEGVKVVGEAESADPVYGFKDAMDALKVTDEAGEDVNLFPTVKLTGPTASKNGQKFDLECLYEKEEEEQ